MICRVPLLTVAHVTALRKMFRLYWGRSFAIIAKCVSPKNSPESAVRVAMQDATDTIDGLEEVNDYLTNLEWVYLTEGIEGANGCAMNEELYGNLVQIVHTPLPQATNLPPKLQDTLKVAQEYRSALITAFMDAGSVDDETLAEEGDSHLDDKVPPKTLLN